MSFHSCRFIRIVSFDLLEYSLFSYFSQLLSGRKVLVSARSCLAEFPESGFRPVWDYDIVIQEQNLKKLRKR